MSDLTNEKILEILKTEGKFEAIRYVKETMKVDIREAKKLVHEIASKDPETKSPKPSRLTGYIVIAVLIAVVWAGCKMCGN